MTKMAISIPRPFACPRLPSLGSAAETRTSSPAWALAGLLVAAHPWQGRGQLLPLLPWAMAFCAWAGFVSPPWGRWGMAQPPSWAGSCSWQDQWFLHLLQAPAQRWAPGDTRALGKHRGDLAESLAVLWSLASCFSRVKQEQCEKQYPGLPFDQGVFVLLSALEKVGKVWLKSRREGEGQERMLKLSSAPGTSYFCALSCPCCPSPIYPPVPELLLTHPCSCMQVCLCVHQVWGHVAQAPHTPCAPGLGLAGTQQPQHQP